MSSADTRLSSLLEQFTNDLQSTDEELRRRAVDEFYALIIAQYVDASSDVVMNIVEQIQDFVRKKLSDPSEIDANRAALLVILCFVCASQNFYIELSNKLEPILRGYKQMSIDANLCELVVKLTVILVKGCGRMRIDQFSHDVPKAIERISQSEKHETRRYSGITILKEIAFAAPARYYHLIIPLEEFFEHLFDTMTDPKQYIREAVAETIHATFLVLIDRERDEQKNNDLAESNTLIRAYTMAYNEALKCLAMKSESEENDARIHGGLLLLNELLRVSNSKFENSYQDLIHPYGTSKSKPMSYKDIHRARVALPFERPSLLSPMDMIDRSKQSQIQVQSSLIRSIMLENFLPICNQVFQYCQQSNPMITGVLIRILPRLASLNPSLFLHQSYRDTTMNFIFERIHSQEHPFAFHALGLMILTDQISLTSLDLTKIVECIKQAFTPTSSCRYSSPDSSVFACITMIGEARPNLSKYFDVLFEQLFHCGLNHSLLLCLEKLCSMPLIHTENKRKIHQGLLENLRLVLSNPVSYERNLTAEQIEIVLITLETLRRFDFEVQAIEPFFIDVLNTHFIEHEITRIRIESIITMTYLLRKLSSTTAHKLLLLKIGSIIQRILTIGVTDSDPHVRYNVFLRFQDDFQQFLVKSESLELLLCSLHDECYEIRELAVSLLGRLSNINPACVLPPLRHLLFQLLNELEIGCSVNGKEQASRLLGQLIGNTPRIARSYMQTISQTLFPLIVQHEQDSNVLIALVRTVGEQVQVCRMDLDQRIDDLFPVLIHMMQDTSNHRKREVALWTMEHIVENCGYVIEPLRQYPILLDILLQFLKSEEEIPFRRETIRLLGLLGAIDLYHVDPLRSLRIDLNDINSIHRVRHESNPIELSSNELLVSSTSQSLPDFYTSTAIYVCLRILKDPNMVQLHLRAVQALTIILQWLGNPPRHYLSLILPCLLSVIRHTDDRNLELYFHQLHLIILSIKHSVLDYMNELVQLIHDYWNRTLKLQILLIQIIESLVNECSHSVHLFLPFLMQIFRVDTNNNHEHLSQLFSTLKRFGQTLKPHFNIVLPAILDVASTDIYPMKLRQEALDAIEQLSEKIRLSDYVSVVLRILLRIVHQTPPLQVKCLDIIFIIARQMGQHFLVFHGLVSKTMDDMKIQHWKYESYISKLTNPSAIDTQIESTVNINPVVPNGQMTRPNDRIIYTKRTDRLRLHWSQGMQQNVKDLPMWLTKFQQLVLEQSPVYPLQAINTYLAQASPVIPRDLFNASFVSCWSELNPNDRSSLTNALTYVLSTSDQPDVIQILLNLSEFRNHCDLQLQSNVHGERSWMDIHLLSEKAFSIRAYAKALRYTEEEFQSESITSDTIESLISINHELQQSEAASGALHYAKNHQIAIKDLWYEKLNQWERALKHYEFRETNDPSNIDLQLGCMRCMQALGSWTELQDLASRVWEMTESIRDDQPLTSLPFSTNLLEKSLSNGGDLKKILQQKIAPMATRAAWSLGDMSAMERYHIHIPNTQFEGAYYRAVNAIRNDNYRQAQDFIDLARELLNTELTTLANESYNRAYSAMINAQLLSELEEVRYYKTSPERRKSIGDIWQKRMQGNQPIIDDYHRLLLTHSLCLPMAEDVQSWIKLANLCYRSNRLSMADFIFKQLERQINPLIKYERAKYDWHCLRERQNRPDQLELIETMKGMIESTLSQPEENLPEFISKCYLRLGTWQYELFGMTNDEMLTEMMNNYEHAWTYDESNGKAWNVYAVFNYDAVNYWKQLPDPTITAAKIIHCSISAVKGLLKSIILSKGKHCLQNTLRLLTLWFEYGHNRLVYDVLQPGIATIPVEVWLQVLPQLIARIDSPKILVYQSIQQLLIDIARQHPQALIYPLVVASKSVVWQRKIAANRVLDDMKKHSRVLVQQAMIVSEEFIRISILWHEKWREGIETVGKHLLERNVQGVIDTLELLHAMIEHGSTTPNERAFLHLYGNELNQAREHFRIFRQLRSADEFKRAWTLYQQVFQRIETQLSTMKSLELDHVSPRLATHSRDFELVVPGTYEPHKPSITIRSVHSRIDVISSKQRPRKIILTASDGYEYVFLLKGHEDLRQDERVMQLFGLVNEFLSANERTHRRNFLIHRYPVIPLAPTSGLLGWIDQCDTLHVLIKDYREKAGIIFDAEHRHMREISPHYEQLPLMNKIEIFESTMSCFDGNDLAKILWYRSSSAEIWLDRRANYTRSLAVMSMVGYILGLGDRHSLNLMLDRTSGKVVHIDFGDCFEVAMVRERYAEKVPFRLTRMLCKAMEVTGIDGTFRLTCEHVMDVLRKNRDSLMAVLEAFVHDPLVNWHLSENNDHPESVNGDGTTQPNRPIRTVEVINRVRDKLIGNDFHREQSIDIPTQVELLIKQATSHENLCQCFVGWCPFW